MFINWRGATGRMERLSSLEGHPPVNGACSGERSLTVECWAAGGFEGEFQRVPSELSGFWPSTAAAARRPEWTRVSAPEEQ